MCFVNAEPLYEPYDQIQLRIRDKIQTSVCEICFPKECNYIFFVDGAF